MKTELSPEVVARRLAQLAALYVPETVEEARARFAAERPRRQESFDEAVGRRLAELRTLLDLTKVLQGSRSKG